MEVSVLIAKTASVIYLSAALGAVISRDQYRRVVEDFFNNAGLTYLTGFIAVILGLLVVNYHNHWTRDWTVLITILGWLTLVKGVMIIAFPKFVEGYSKAILKGKGSLIFPYIAAFVGLLFGYFGFVR